MLLLFLIAIPFVLVALHECGHLIANWCVGFRPERIVVGPIIIERQNSRLRLRFNPLNGESLSMYPKERHVHQAVSGTTTG